LENEKAFFYACSEAGVDAEKLRSHLLKLRTGGFVRQRAGTGLSYLGYIMTPKMLSHRYLFQGTSLDLEPPDQANPPNPWQIISAVVAALAAVFSAIAHWKESRAIAFVLGVAALLVAASVFYRPMVAAIRVRVRNIRRNRVARSSCQEFLRMEERFGDFLNQQDTINLRNIISDICGPK